MYMYRILLEIEMILCLSNAHSHICMWMEYRAENTKSSNSVPWHGIGILHSSQLLKYTYHIHFDIHALACIRTSILTLTHGPYTKRAQPTKQISFKFYVDRFWIGFRTFSFSLVAWLHPQLQIIQVYWTKCIFVWCIGCWILHRIN